MDLQHGTQAKAEIFILSGLFVAFMGVLLWKGELMPMTRNILFNIGLGPPTLKDVYLLNLPHLPAAPKIVWLAVTAASVFGAVLLFQNLFSGIRLFFSCSQRAESLAGKWLLLSAISVSALYFITIGTMVVFDRYLIFLMPLLMLVILSARHPIQLPLGRLPALIALPTLVIYTIFTLGATHDYLSWNRTRWKALRYLTEEARVSYKKIDGGFEFNGWYGYDSKYQGSKNKSWWWVYDDDYIISFGPLMNYDEIMRYPYKRWIPAGQGYIFVLKKHKV